MKKTLLLLLVGCLVGTTLAQEKIIYDINSVNHYITGTLSINTDGNQVLLNPRGKGINFSMPGVDKVGDEQPNGEFQYVFENISVPGLDGLDGRKLFFYTREGNVWKHRVEVQDDKSRTETAKSLLYVFVLDCSASIGKKDYKIMRDDMKTLIANIGKHSGYKENVHIGLITFSNTVKVFGDGIVPLNERNADLMEKYISDMNQQYQTALYKAIDSAMILIDKYIDEHNINFSEINLITFTDGSDNMSRDKSRGFFKPEDYKIYLEKELGGKCSSKYVSSFIALPGIEENRTEMQTVANSLDCSGKAYMAKDMKDVMQRIERIVFNSINKYTDLYCNIPVYDGKDALWVLDYNKKAQAPHEKINELGIIVGLIDGLSYKFYNPKSHFAFELDLGAQLWPYINESCNDYQYYDSYYSGCSSYYIRKTMLSCDCPSGLSASLLYQKGFGRVTHGFIGCNARLGVGDGYLGVGINGMVGLEWIWKHFAIQIDTRLGYAYQEVRSYIDYYAYELYYDQYVIRNSNHYREERGVSFTDFSANLSLRYRW